MNSCHISLSYIFSVLFRKRVHLYQAQRMSEKAFQFTLPYKNSNSSKVLNNDNLHQTMCMHSRLQDYSSLSILCVMLIFLLLKVNGLQLNRIIRIIPSLTRCSGYFQQFLANCKFFHNTVLYLMTASLRYQRFIRLITVVSCLCATSSSSSAAKHYLALHEYHFKPQVQCHDGFKLTYGGHEKPNKSG